MFLGPDSYRFVRFMAEEILPLGKIRHLVDMGAGAGVGGIAVAPLVGGAKITLTDINPLASMPAMPASPPKFWSAKA